MGYREEVRAYRWELVKVSRGPMFPPWEAVIKGGPYGQTLLLSAWTEDRARKRAARYIRKLTKRDMKLR
jgi:hypothetical protein